MKQINSDDAGDDSEPMHLGRVCCERRRRRRRRHDDELFFHRVDRLWRTVSTGIGNSQHMRSIRLKAADNKGCSPCGSDNKHQFHSVPALSAATDCSSDAIDCGGNEEAQPGNQDKENHFRPVYVIRPNHHIFGCASYEEEDPDEFFISSGCVRASCPNIYEATLRATSARYGWQSCAELEHLVDDATYEINSYQIDNYEMKVRNARLPRRNSEVSSTTTTATTISPSNELVFADGARCNRHRSLAAVGLPPLRLPVDDVVHGHMDQQREKALSLIVLAKSQVERGWRRHRLGGRMRRWNQPLRSLDASSNLQWKSDTSSPAY